MGNEFFFRLVVTTDFDHYIRNYENINMAVYHFNSKVEDYCIDEYKTLPLRVQLFMIHAPTNKIVCSQEYVQHPTLLGV